MADGSGNLVSRIDAAIKRITEVFVQQCTYGAQTKSLPNEFASCGQFIGDEASRIEQHGLHGTAAALRVLGPCQTDACRSLVTKLVNYCEASFDIHPTLSLLPDQRIKDLDNVIKLGELLYGLSFVSAAQVDTSRLSRHVADQLQKSRVDGRSWGYFLGEHEGQLLPTVYAIRGLAQHGFDVVASRKFVIDTLGSRVLAVKESPADLTTAVACAYCLTFPRIGNTDETVIIDTFREAWRALEPSLDEDVEQNLEYWRGTSTHYVRVPWQLYLLALASEHSFWRFATFRAQTRLNRIIAAIGSASFKYPYSGRHLSSRTNGIAYDVLVAIRERVRRLAALRVAYAVDRVRVIAGARWVSSPW